MSKDVFKQAHRHYLKTCFIGHKCCNSYNSSMRNIKKHTRQQNRQYVKRELEKEYVYDD